MPFECPVCKKKTAGHIWTAKDAAHQHLVSEQTEIILKLVSEGKSNTEIENDPRVVFRQYGIARIVNPYLVANGREGKDFVTCQLCGKRMRQLFRHIKAEHQLSLDAYRVKFPGAANLYQNARSKIANAMTEKNPMSNPTHFKRMLEAREEVREDWMNAIHAAQLTRKLSPLSSKTHSRGGFRNDLGHYVRSAWEANFARVLKSHSVQYQYEQHRFELIDEENSIHLIYVPDFYIPVLDLLVEIKGQETERSKNIDKIISTQYPNMQRVVLHAAEMYQITHLFGYGIDCWEDCGYCRRWNHAPSDSDVRRKLGYMRETPSILQYLTSTLSKNLLGADNPQGRASGKVSRGITPLNDCTPSIPEDASAGTMIQSVLHSDMQRQAEMSCPDSEKNPVTKRFYEYLGIAQLTDVGSCYGTVTGSPSS